MANILLIETATSVCSAAIAVDGRVVALVEDAGASNHAAQLTLFIQACTQRCGLSLRQLDAVAISQGPGSYTALRVGASVAKGICYALDKPLIAVSTLQALAMASLDEYEMQDAVFALPMIDARRNEVWAAVYDAGLGAVLPPQPLIVENNLFVEFLKTIPGARAETVYVVSGNGAFKLTTDQNLEQTVFSSIKKCSAGYLSGLAEQFFQVSDFQDVSYFEPFYMKSPNITVSRKALF